jgi:iron complex outermembrane receptor protein
MKLGHLQMSLVLGAGLSGLVATAASAQDHAQPTQDQAQPGQDARASDEIVVTARRRQELLQDVPISITVYNQEQLTNRNIVMGSDLAVYTPSLTVNQRFGPETSSFAIRGFLQEANTAPSVGVYFAEVTTPRSLGLTAAGSNLAIGAFMDLENTQVLKGPQGTLFGRNTTGGAILLVPKRPTDKLEGYAELSAGDYNMLRGQAVLNIPVTDSLKVRLGIDRMQRDGYMRNRSGIGPHAYNDTNYFYARLSILANLTPDLENYTVAHYSKSDTNGYAARIVLCERNLLTRTTLGAGIFTGPSACAQLDRQAARGDGPFDVDVPVQNPFFKIEQWQLINHTTWTAADNLTIKNIISYSSLTADLQYRLGGENFNTLPTGLPLPVPVVVGLPYTSTDIALAPTGNHSADQWTFTEELQFQGSAADRRLQWQAGGYLEISKSPHFNEGYTNIFLNCPGQRIQALQCFDPFGFGNISNARQKSSYNNKALYAQATYDISDQFSVTGGIRYTWDKLNAINEATRFLFPLAAPGTVVRVCNDRLTFHNPDGTPLVITDPAQCHREIPTKSKKPTWIIDLDYKPTHDLLFYAKYARGYRAGGVAVLNLGLEVWEPEKLDTYEIGAKASFHGPVRGYFNAAAFYNDFTNQQLVSTTRDKVTHVAQGNAIVNAGSSTIKGFEVDSSITLFDSLDLSVGYTYLNTKIKKLVPPTSSIYDIDLLAHEGDPLPQVPKHRITASAKYTLPLDASIGKISFGATFVHTSKQLFNRNSHPDFLFLPATDLLNININWDKVMGQPIDLAFFMTNVTDELYPVTNGGEYKSLAYESVQYGAPRMWGLRVRYNFGD